MAGEVATAIVVDGDNWDSWRSPQERGTADAVYIEDCTFEVSPWNDAVAYGTTDCERGGRFVLRHNTVTNQIEQCHGFDSGQHASCMSMEVYANTHRIRTATTAAWAWLGQIRGDTALWFDNTDVPPACGDGECAPGETCSGCPADCCPEQGGQSGGSGCGCSTAGGGAAGPLALLALAAAVLLRAHRCAAGGRKPHRGR